jgi:hypothetical protein
MIQSHANRVALAAIITGLVDGAFSSILSTAVYGSTVTRLFQRVASTLLGPTAFDGGLSTAFVGVLMHFGVALGWSTVFFLLYESSPRLRAVLASPEGILVVAAAFGMFVWLTMSLVILPLLSQAPPINARWLIQLLGHFPFVGIPIVWTIARGDHGPARADRAESVRG